MSFFFQSDLLIRIVDLSKYYTSIKNDIIDTNFSIAGLSSGKTLSKRVVYLGLLDGKRIDDGHLKEIIKKILESNRKAVYVEIRNIIEPFHSDNLFIKAGFYVSDWLNIILDTPNRNDVWSQINQSKRNQINKSIRNGATIHHAQNLEEVKSFYSILKYNYNRKIRKPLPDWLFFKSFFEQTNERDQGSYILVKFNDKVIAGMMCPVDPEKMIYEWYIGGLDKEYNRIGIYPSTLVTWGAIKYAYEHNIPKFNFMGAGRPGIPYGVRDFKLQFGGKLINTGRYVKINKPFLYKLGETYFKIRKYI
jgi:serine/alanine adding enzyme